MITCDTCGCLVDPEMTQQHSDWHDDLVTKSGLRANSLANPNRTKVNEPWPGIFVQDC